MYKSCSVRPAGRDRERERAAANMSCETETCHVIPIASLLQDVIRRRAGRVRTCGARAGTGEALAVPLISDILTS